MRSIEYRIWRGLMTDGEKEAEGNRGKQKGGGGLFDGNYMFRVWALGRL